MTPSMVHITAECQQAVSELLCYWNFFAAIFLIVYIVQTVDVVKYWGHSPQYVERNSDRIAKNINKTITEEHSSMVPNMFYFKFKIEDQIPPYR